MKRNVCIALVVAALDQAVKALVRNMPVGKTLFVIPGIVELTHQVNTGAAFSMLSGRPVFLAVISAVLLAVMYVYAQKQMHLTSAAWIAIGCLIGGGIGNLLDRVLLSGVTDYIRLLFLDFPVFNLADIAITCSIAILIILLITDRLEENTEAEDGSGC